MKHLVLTVAALAAATSLTACGKKETATTEAAAPPAVPAAAPATAPASDMAGMPMAADAKMAKGTGTVTEVGGDTITVNHAPIPEANWPAMTMGFKAAPELAKSVKVGDKVAFDLKLEGGAGTITAIQKQ